MLSLAFDSECKLNCYGSIRICGNADSSSAEPTENESVSQITAEVAVKESSPPEESEGQGSSSESTSEESVDVSTEEPSVVEAALDDMTSESTEAVESVEESGEPVWPEQLRAKLLKRFRSSRNKRAPRPSYEKKSRWEFWHGKVGLCSLKDWLIEASLDDVSQTMFSQTIEQMVHYDIHSIGDLLLRPPVEYEKFPFSTLDRSIGEGTTTLRGKILQKYIAIGPVLKHWTVVLEGKDNVELRCSWASMLPDWERYRSERRSGCW